MLDKRNLLKLFAFFFIKVEKKITSKLTLNGDEKVLVIKLDEIGDFILMLPMIREFKWSLPRLRIDVLIKENLRNIAELCPYFNNIFYLKAVFFKKNKIFKLLLIFYSIIYAIFFLRKQKYDIVIIPRWDVDSSYAVFFSFFSNAKLRITYTENVSSQKSIFNKNYDLLYTHTLIDEAFKHEVERSLFFLEFLNIIPNNNKLELWFDSTDELIINDYISQFDSNEIVAICPVASMDRKKWKYSNYQEIINWLINKYGFNVIIIGGGEDRSEFEFKAPEGFDKKIKDLRGLLTLRQSSFFLKESILYVGNDTGPMHLAAAVDTPVIEISCQPFNVDKYHSQSPLRFTPWGVRYKLLQPKFTIKPCPNNMCISSYSHCINNVSVADVQFAIATLLCLPISHK